MDLWPLTTAASRMSSHATDGEDTKGHSKPSSQCWNIRTLWQTPAAHIIYIVGLLHQRGLITWQTQISNLTLNHVNKMTFSPDLRPPGPVLVPRIHRCTAVDDSSMFTCSLKCKEQHWAILNFSKSLCTTGLCAGIEPGFQKCPDVCYEAVRTVLLNFQCTCFQSVIVSKQMSWSVTHDDRCCLALWDDSENVKSQRGCSIACCQGSCLESFYSRLSCLVLFGKSYLMSVLFTVIP